MICRTNEVYIKCAKIDEETLDYAFVDCVGDVTREERTSEHRNRFMASFALNLILASTVCSG